MTPRRWVNLLAVLFVASAILNLVALSSLRQSNRALQRTAHIERQLHRHDIRDELVRQRVCADNYPAGCQLLWDRLLHNSTREQGHLAACELIAALGRRPFTVRERRLARCPPRLPAMPPLRPDR